MLELKKGKTADSKDIYALLIDNELVANGYERALRHEKPNVFVFMHEYEESERVAAHGFSEIPLEIELLRLTLDHGWSDMDDTVEIERLSEDNSFRIGFKFEFNYEEWKGPFSFTEYATAFDEAIEQINDPGITWEQDDEALANGFWVKLSIPSPQSSIADEVLGVARTLTKLKDTVLRNLESQVTSGSIVVSFDFPEEVKVACEQYLLYFVQFLSDLGVAATSELRHDAGQALFTVTPTNENDALDKIRTALDLYLRMPANPLGGLSGVENEIAVQRLVSCF